MDLPGLAASEEEGHLPDTTGAVRERGKPGRKSVICGNPQRRLADPWNTVLYGVFRIASQNIRR